MSTFKRLLISSVFGVVVFTLPQNLRAQSLQAIVGSQLASDLLSQIGSEIDSLLGRLDVSIGSATFAASQSARLVVDETRFAATQMIGKTLDELNKSQRDFVNNSFALLTELRKTATDTSNEFQAVVDKAALSLSVIPSANREPRITGYSPVFSLSPIKAGDNVTVGVKGLFLNHGPATMELEGNKCSVRKSTDL
jgi:hypothetical protein